MKVPYVNYRVVYNTFTNSYSIAVIRYDENGAPINPPSPIMELGSSLKEVEETLESLLHDVKNYEKEILVIDNSGKIV